MSVEPSELKSILSRLERLESAVSIRRVLMRYMQICDTLGPATRMEELGELFTAEAIWQGQGARYRETFGGFEGRSAILNMLDTYRRPVPHFVLNAHYLTSEDLAVEELTAQGSWNMLQVSTYASGRSHLASARLDITFERSDGQWRMRVFTTTSLFSRPVTPWDVPTPMPVPVART